jgi:lipopolysaccharide transport system ATP-binding protein
MTNKIISVEHLSKRYDLGVIGTGTLTKDLNRWWARIRKRPDPYTKIGQKDTFASIGKSILALDDINFQVEQGEALGIIGRNGAGKSTLLKIISRITAPTRGAVRIKGRIGSLLEVGTGFHPDLTGRENIFLNGAILGMRKSEVERKFDEIIEFSGIEKFIDTPVKRYSSGMYVRLAFAVAAHLESEILVIDEVLAVGDAEFQKKCLGKMDSVTGEGRTVLFVSHNMQAIQNFCTRAILLDHGEIVLNSTPEDAISLYLKSSFENQTERNWSPAEAPGNEQMRITRAWVRNISPSANNDIFTTRDELQIGFEFQNNLPGENVFDLAIHLENEMGILVLSTNTFDKQTPQLEKGTHIATCTIPANLLNQGTYAISTLRFVVNQKKIVFECPDILTFDVMIAADKGFGWVGKPSGVILTDFDWVVQ